MFAPILASVILRSSSGPAASIETDGDGFSVGYFAVYAVAFGVSILGSVFVTRIRSVP